MSDPTNQHIQVKVKFFAAPREALGQSEITLSLPRGATVADLVERLKQAHPVLRAYTHFLSVAVNKAYVGRRRGCGSSIRCGQASGVGGMKKLPGVTNAITTRPPTPHIQLNIPKQRRLLPSLLG